MRDSWNHARETLLRAALAQMCLRWHGTMPRARAVAVRACRDSRHPMPPFISAREWSHVASAWPNPLQIQLNTSRAQAHQGHSWMHMGPLLSSTWDRADFRLGSRCNARAHMWSHVCYCHCLLRFAFDYQGVRSTRTWAHYFQRACASTQSCSWRRPHERRHRACAIHPSLL